MSDPLVDTDHDYTSTACQHRLHLRCRLTCKFCLVHCKCECHSQEWEDQLVVEAKAAIVEGDFLTSAELLRVIEKRRGEGWNSGS